MAEENTETPGENTGQDVGNADGIKDAPVEAQQKPTASGEKKPAVRKNKTPEPTKGGDTETGNHTLAKIGREALVRNPQMHTVFVTGDGVVFSSRSDAENHARTLENKSIETVTE